MVQEKHKGEAGQGGRGKNRPATRQNRVKRRRARNPQPSANRTRPADEPRGNQKRNQGEWQAEKRSRSRY
jgi:hypothetical protein